MAVVPLTTPATPPAESTITTYKADTELLLVPIPDVMRIMPTIAPMLEPAIARSGGRWTLWDVIAGVLQSHMQLWLAVADDGVKAAMVTRFVDYPRMRALGLLFIGGSMRKMWMDHEEKIAEWAHEQGCVELEGYARKGWLRLLPHWKHDWTFITRKV